MLVAPSMPEPHPNVVDIDLPLTAADDVGRQREAVARKLKIAPKRIINVRIAKRSIDARKREIRMHMRVEVGIDHPLPDVDLPRPEYPCLPAGARRVIVVGSGPAGLFAALRLIEQGIKPVVLERGKDASARRFDLAPILRQGRVIEDSNYCFGEGGAGTFSDGKLYTRATKRGPVSHVYETFVAHGAPPDILVDAHPHIGSNLLPNVVMAMRRSILDAGGEVHFNQKVTDLVVEQGRAVGVLTQQGMELTADAVLLATGHSARDIFQLFAQRNWLMEPKPFAVGVRIEHPQHLIDAQQYHLKSGENRPAILPAASYRLATKLRDRGVHSFCMCPGGFIVPAATENDEVVVNGMSLSRRDSYFANSGLVVTVEPEDTRALVADFGVLAGIAFQKRLEQAAKQAGGGGQVAPAQRVPDFLKGVSSKEPNRTSYHPGVTSARLDELLPQGIVERLRQGLRLFGRQLRGFDSPEGQLIGVETRTSSPLRIPRDPDRLEHPEVAGLFPCGEGAGYAGGIVSAALDGIRCADAIVAKLKT